MCMGMWVYIVTVVGGEWRGVYGCVSVYLVNVVVSGAVLGAVVVCSL